MTRLPKPLSDGHIFAIFHDFGFHTPVCGCRQTNARSCTCEHVAFSTTDAVVFGHSETCRPLVCCRGQVFTLEASVTLLHTLALCVNWVHCSVGPSPLQETCESSHQLKSCAHHAYRKHQHKETSHKICPTTSASLRRSARCPQMCRPRGPGRPVPRPTSPNLRFTSRCSVRAAAEAEASAVCWLFSTLTLATRAGVPSLRRTGQPKDRRPSVMGRQPQPVSHQLSGSPLHCLSAIQRHVQSAEHHDPAALATTHRSSAVDFLRDHWASDVGISARFAARTLQARLGFYHFPAVFVGLFISNVPALL